MCKARGQATDVGMQYQMNFVLSLLAESEFKNRNIMETNMQKPDNNLVWAILATVLCCLPFGIVAIIKSTQVDSFWAAGRYDEAVQAAADARKWCWVSVIVSVVVIVLYFLLIAGVAGLAVVGSQL